MYALPEKGYFCSVWGDCSHVGTWVLAILSHVRGLFHFNMICPNSNSEKFKNCTDQIRWTGKSYVVHGPLVCVHCSKQRPSCFYLVRSIEVSLGMPRQKAEGCTGDLLQSPANPQIQQNPQFSPTLRCSERKKSCQEQSHDGCRGSGPVLSSLLSAPVKAPPLPPPPPGCQQADLPLQAAPHSWQRMPRQTGIETLAKADFLN